MSSAWRWPSSVEFRIGRTGRQLFPDGEGMSHEDQFHAC